MTQLITKISRGSKTVVAKGAWQTVDDLVDALGGVSLERILFDPVPGTATERDLIKKVDGERRFVELIDGTLVEKAESMGLEEELVGAAIMIVLGNFVSRHRLGFVGGARAPMRTVGKQIRMPDAFYISRRRLNMQTIKAHSVGPVAPDLSVEVLSPKNTRREMLRKRREMFKSGTGLIWEIDVKKQTFTVYTAAESPDVILDAKSTLTGGTVLTGFKLSLAKFWASFDE